MEHEKNEISPRDADVSKETAEEINKALSCLQAGVNDWDVTQVEKAKHMFDDLLSRHTNRYLLYYAALCDYRLAGYYLAGGRIDEIEKYIVEGKKFLEQSIQSDPDFGESYALYGTLLGYEIALHPEKSMELGYKTYEYFSKSIEKDPGNPRINFLKGNSLLFTPVEFGGGPDNACAFYKKAVELFDKEKNTDSLKPSWGRDEAYAYYGLAYKMKNDTANAKKYLEKSVEINPRLRLALDALAQIGNEGGGD